MDGWIDTWIDVCDGGEMQIVKKKKRKGTYCINNNMITLIGIWERKKLTQVTLRKNILRVCCMAKDRNNYINNILLLMSLFFIVSVSYSENPLCVYYSWAEK